MKRANDLYRWIAEPENLRLAFWKAQRGKGHRPEVQAFRAELEKRLQEMREALQDRAVPVGDYHYFTVRDPKERQICAAAFRERVLHHAILNVCEPIFERYAIDDTYACRPGKGTHRAVVRAQYFARRFPFCVKMDIARYFDSIDHGVLLCRLERLFKDRDLVWLFERILMSYQTASGKGLPIGNLTSQHFANLYLGALDHHVKEGCRVKGYLRYMDDFLGFGESKEQVRCLLSGIRAFVQEELLLQLRDGVEKKPCAAGVSFLGYRVFPHRTGLTRRSRRRFADKLRAYETEFAEGRWGEAELARRMQAVVGFTEWADAVGFRRKVIAELGVWS